MNEWIPPPPISTFNIAQRELRSGDATHLLPLSSPAPYLFYARLAITVMVDWALKNIYSSRCYWTTTWHAIRGVAIPSDLFSVPSWPTDCLTSSQLEFWGERSGQITPHGHFVFLQWVVDRFYLAGFSAVEQTPCALVTCNSKGATVAF